MPTGDGEMKRSDDLGFLVGLRSWLQPVLAVVLLVVVLLVVRSTFGIWAGIGVAAIVLAVSLLLLRIWGD